jgi:hypothetical protein
MNKPVILGILGTNGKISQHDIINSVILPSLEEFNILKSPIYQVIFPDEGETSIYIEDYFERKLSSIYVCPITCNWREHGPSARRIRDTHITQDATHFIIFLGKTSKYYEKLAEQLIRREKEVIMVSYLDYELTRLEREIPSSKKSTCPKITDYFTSTI